MKNINTLVEDIYKLVKHQEAPELSAAFGDNVAGHYARQLAPRDKVRGEGKLYFSEVGEKCFRKLWWRYNGGVEQQPLTPATRIKFLYGDMLEELVLQLARDAGHDVCDEQKEVKYEVEGTDGWVISGRLDACIDGEVVDVKSVTRFSEQKFHRGLVDDPFNYYSQLNGYACAEGKTASFLTIQKELGHINLFPIVPDISNWREVTKNAVKVVTGELPEERYALVPQSKTSKNLKLPTQCSYCDYKKECWKDANDGEGLRGYAYSDKVVWLAQVFEEPRVPLIT